MKKNYEICTDEELLSLISEKDQQALEMILVRYKEPVRRKAASMYLLGGEREDLIQEGMIGLLGAVRSYDRHSVSSFAHYADICVARKMYSAIESSRRQKQIPLNTYVSLFEKSEIAREGEQLPLLELLENEQGKNPETLLIEQENTAGMERRMRGQLSAFEQQVLDLMLTGMNYSQIAEVLGKTAKQADNAIQRIRRKLKKMTDCEGK